MPVCTTRMSFSALAALTILNSARADDWPQWAGSKRDGVWREKGLLDRFPAGGLKIRWRVPIGGGYSGPAVVGNRLYVMDRPGAPPQAPGQEARVTKDAIPGTERILCADTDSGKTLWTHDYDCPYQVSYASGPRVTPTVVNGKVFTLGTMGDLRCLDAEKGSLIWARDFRKDFGLKRAPAWGWSSSLLVEGDRLYSLVGGDGSAVVCFDAANGKEIWRALTAKEVGYAPLLLADVANRKQLIVWHPEETAGLDPATGKVIWSLPYPIEGELHPPEVNIAAPRIIGDRLLASSFYQGAMLLKLPAGEGKPEVVWNKLSPNLMRPSLGLHTVMCTPMLRDGYIYGICGHGELRCLKLDTAERMWETLAAVNHKRGLFANAFLVEQADRYWIYNDQGDLILAKLTPLGYEESGRVHLLDTTLETRGRQVTWCHPAFANKCAYVRSDKEMVCVSLAKE